MVTITRLIGVALILVGVIAYVSTGAESVTALAPAVVGVLLLVLGVLAGDPGRVRSMMHAALVVSLLGVVASGMPLRDLPTLLAGDDVERPVAVVTAGIMAVLCLVHVGFGVRSFVLARRARGSGSTPTGA